MENVQQPTQSNPQVGLDTGAIGGLPLADPAAQTAMPSADNPNTVPLFGQVGVGQRVTLDNAGQQGAFAVQPQRFDSVQPQEHGGMVNARTNQLAKNPQRTARGAWIEPSADGSYVETGRANEYMPASVLNGRTTARAGDPRAGLMGNGYKQGTEDAFLPVKNQSPLPGTNSIPGLGGRQANRRMLNPNIPAYADGGMIGQPPNGQPGLAPQGAPQGYTDPKLFDSQINDMLTRNPQVKQQIQQEIQKAIQSGELNPQMAQMAVQLAQASIQNPALYPQLRQFAIQRGLAEPTELPEQYDEGLVMTILIAAKAATGMEQGQMPQQPQQALAGGGLVQGPGTGTSDSVPAVNTSNGGQVAVSNGEFIIPADVVAAKGKDYFDALVAKYHGRIPRQ